MAVVSYKDTMKRLLRTPMQKTFTFLGVTLIVLIVFIMGAIRPTLNTISELNNEIKIKKEVNDDLQTKINNLQSLQNVYQEREDELSSIDVYFPQNSDYSLILASLEKICSTYGFELNSLSVSVVDLEDTSGKSYSGMGQVEVGLRVSGRRANVTELIEHVEGLPIIPNVRRVSFSPSEQEEESGWVQVSVDMYTYKAE